MVVASSSHQRRDGPVIGQVSEEEVVDVGAVEMVDVVVVAYLLFGAVLVEIVVGAVVVVLVLEIIGQGRYPKRSVLMNFMQSANDPTVSELMHSFFIVFSESKHICNWAFFVILGSPN